MKTCNLFEATLEVPRIISGATTPRIAFIRTWYATLFRNGTDWIVQGAYIPLLSFYRSKILTHTCTIPEATNRIFVSLPFPRICFQQTRGQINRIVTWLPFTSISHWNTKCMLKYPIPIQDFILVQWANHYSILSSQCLQHFQHLSTPRILDSLPVH